MVAAEEGRLVAADGATLEYEPPFGAVGAPGIEALLAHAARERVVGVLLVRLGGCAAGVFAGSRLLDSKVDRRLVHGRHRKGGSSARRFERRREGQAREALRQAADVAARVLLAHDLDVVVRGGDRRAVDLVLEDPRLVLLRAKLDPRVLDVPDPRLDVLRALPDRFRATVLRPIP